MAGTVLQYYYLHSFFMYPGAHGGTVGWEIVLQARRWRVPFLMVSLQFFINIIFLTALWPWCWQSLLMEMSTSNISWRVKASDWQSYHLHVPIVLNSVSLNLLEPTGPLQATIGESLCVTLWVLSCKSKVKK
jgi:hypothetical protein